MLFRTCTRQYSPMMFPLQTDFLGDQFLLRDGLVVRLYGETGEKPGTWTAARRVLGLGVRKP